MPDVYAWYVERLSESVAVECMAVMPDVYAW